MALASVATGIGCGAALAQSSTPDGSQPAATESNGAGNATPSSTSPQPDTVDDQTLARALAVDPFGLSPLQQPAQLQQPKSLDADKTFKWNKADNSDGSTNYSVNRPLAAPWAVSVGADISVAPAIDPSAPIDPTPYDSAGGPGAGSAYANVTVPDIAKVEVRAEPANDHDRVAASLQRSIPIGKSFSFGMQSSVGLTENVRTPGAPDPVITGTVAVPAQDRTFDADQSVTFNVLPTGTSLLAGTTTFTGDPMIHRRVGATQKIYGPLSVTGTLTDPGQSTESKSISAGLNFSW
jgi:hypothetical protein